MTIVKLAENYHKFQSDFGCTNVYNYQLISELFAENFTKIVNRETLVAKRDDLEKQLTDLKKVSGEWEIIVKYNIPSADDKFCTMRYELHSQNIGNFDIIALLGSSDGLRIDSVDEVGVQFK
jgi:hypothetical protein